MPNTTVLRSPGKGRGVFATAPIARGTTIETCETILFPRTPSSRTLERYGFETHGGQALLVALGNGSLYNHSFTPNARYSYAPGFRIVFTARRRIAEGEEITINYNGVPTDKTPVPFD